MKPPAHKQPKGEPTSPTAGDMQLYRLSGTLKVKTLPVQCHSRSHGDDPHFFVFYFFFFRTDTKREALQTSR